MADHGTSKVIAVIPTRNRPAIVVKAVQSVFAQTFKPSLLIVVGQTEPDLSLLRPQSEGNEFGLTPVMLLKNARAANLSGSLNTALTYIASHEQEPERTFIAFLDDDDEWDSEYLETCVIAADRRKLDWVVAGIERHEAAKGKGERLGIPRKLTVHDFLVGNPHVQGSNLFVRFSTIMKAGLFDENLESTTDRDIAIRLLDLGDTGFGMVRKHLVHHFAFRTNRLSSPGSQAKRNGLVTFYNKYSPRMTPREKFEFVKRAVDLFGCSPSDFGSRLIPPGQILGGSTFQLVVGFTASNELNSKRLLSDLAKLPSDCRPSALVLCKDKGEISGLRPLLASFRSQKAKIREVQVEDIRRSADEGVFGSYYQDRAKQTGIAFFRTALQHFLYLESSTFQNPVVWILDDDMRLEGPLTDEKSDRTGGSLLSHLIGELRSRGVDIAIGNVAGDPPIPGGSMLRTQLLDLEHSIKALTNPNFVVDRELLQRQRELLVEKYPDFYYDLTLNGSGHLETPFLYMGEGGSTDRLVLLEEMLERVPLIAQGVNAFRPKPSSISTAIDENPLDPTRGGNTLVLNIDCLRDYPNLSPRIGGLQARRGDTLWTILNKRANSRDEARKVVAFGMSTRQDRRNNPGSIFKSDNLIADIFGSAFTRAVNEELKNPGGRSASDSGADGFRFSGDQIARILVAFTKLLSERLNILSVNSWRIEGLVNSIRTETKVILRRGGREAEVLAKYSTSLEAFLADAANAFSHDAVARISDAARAYSKSDVEEFLKSLGDYVEQYRTHLAPWDGISSTEQIANWVRHKFGKPELKLLGHGSEGVTLTDGVQTYKFFFTGTRNFGEGQLDFITRRCDDKHLSWAKHISPVEKIVVEGTNVVFVSKFVPGREYSGNMQSSLIELLKECRRANIVIRNISPANLVVEGDSLTMVDMGRSVHPLDEEGYLAMCKRAYLVYKWHFRSDLKELLHRALNHDDLPELFGFDQFLASLRVFDPHDALDGPLLDFVGRTRPSTILDYGSGNGGLADKLAQWGIEITAYDIDATRYLSHHHLANITFVGKEELQRLRNADKRYRTVLCSLVLCSVDDTQVQPIVADLRRLVDSSGDVVVVICNPFDLDTFESETHTKSLPFSVNYSENFSYLKGSKSTKGTRLDYHRPLEWYKTRFRRAGLEVTEIVEVRGTDIPRTAPSGDFMIIRLKPVKIPEQTNVSLMVRASAMEWRTIRKQVTHIVTQLEYPRLFLEKLVVTDDFEGPFSRQYEAPDKSRLMKELQRLVDNGVIDRIISAPNDSSALSGLASRWFSIDSPVFRAENGQPVMTTLQGFEQCKGRYVLQTDSDSLIFRPDKNYDYLTKMLAAFERDDKVVTLSFSIACGTPEDYSKSSVGGKWRTEVRCGLIDLERLKGLLPLENSVNEAGELVLPWHRALDKKLECSDFESYRGSDPKAFYIHVTNDRKADFNSWYNTMKAVESGRMLEAQLGSVNLVGTTEDWLGRRTERCILVVRGRNVPVSKIRRCFDSLAAQTDQNWGLLVVDAGSTNGAEEYVDEIIAPKYKQRMTFYRNLVLVSPVENINYSVRVLCGDRHSIIVMPDEDDAFLCRDAIEYIKTYYDKGRDLVIGGLLRTDKQAFYLANFENPRASRGGNVWQPLRTFKKYLFDGIRVEDLKVDGVWVPHTEDWAVMLPMAEMAKLPAQFDRTIYLYEPSILKEELSKAERESLIPKIVGKPRYTRIENA